MTEQTLVAVYDTEAHAAAAIADLKAANIPADAIGHHAKAGSMPSTSRTEPVAAREQGFWSSLFGSEPDHDTSVYDRSIDSGSTVVTVRVPAERFEHVSAILEQHDPIDLEERAAQYAPAGVSATRTTTTAGSSATPGMSTRETAALAPTDGSLQLSEETLSVGKRAVSGGTTRIRRYVVETPVEKSVTLQTEKVSLERRPVTDGRTVNDAGFSDKTIEMTETSEEAVVSKIARVKEEVSLRKEVTERVETVKDTVRRDEVEIEKVPGDRISPVANPAAVTPRAKI